MFRAYYGTCKKCPPSETKLIVTKNGLCRYHNEELKKNKKTEKPKSEKKVKKSNAFRPHTGNCSCCGQPGMITVKSGLRVQCNEKKKQNEKSKRVVKIVNKSEKRGIKQLKVELDTVFSLYVRQKDADENGINKCFTCNKIDHWKNLHCGHYVSRRHTSLRWDIRNTAPQCPKCNLYNQGASDAFAIHLKKVYGDSILDILEMKKNNKTNWGRFEYELLIKEFTQKLNDLKTGIK